MSTVLPPTPLEIWEDGLELVERDVDDGWRHGVDVFEIYHRVSDNTYWSVQYRRSPDGDYNGLRQGEADIYRVKPVETTITVTKFHAWRED